MAKRNYKNDRYMTDDAKKGVTKKSASKAKVSREAASTVYVKDTSKVKKSKKQLRYEEKVRQAKKQQQEERRYNRVAGPGAAESVDRTKDHSKSKKLRRWWWAFLGAAAVFAFAAYKTQGTTWFYVFIILSYTSVFAAIIFEFWKIRKVRDQEFERSERKRTTKRIKHELEEEKEERDKKMMKKFRKRGEVDEDLPFQ